MRVEERGLAELRRIATFFYSIVENIPAMVFVKDATTRRYVLVNRAVEQVLGLSREEMVGKTDADLCSPEEAELFRASDEEAIGHGAVIEIPEQLLTRDRGPRMLQTKKLALFDEDGRPTYLLRISQDITERHAAEKDLEKLRAAVAAAVIHDFRAPLQTLLAGVEVLAGRSDREEVARSTIAELREEVTRLMRLSNDMLDATRVAIEDVSINPEIVDLAALTTTIVDGYRRRAPAHVIEIRTPSVVPPVAVDPARLEQILHNLLDNAARHAPAGSTITVEIARDARGGCIRVIDRGSGIAAADLPRVFDRFFQSADQHKRGTGLGLGLFIAQGLVRAHGGRIDVDSEVGGGATFRVWFPAVT